MKKGSGLLAIPCSGGPVDGAPDMIRLLPLGQVKSRKGDFVVDEESFLEMCGSIKAHGVDVVVDYEHQTLKDVQAPAAGWIKELVLSDGAVCGRVEWTPRAAEYLKNREYRYLSPVVLTRPSDRKALRLQSVALTNTPAIDGMYPIINSINFEEREDAMEFLQQIAALLGLPEGATEEEALAAVKEKLSARGGEVIANKTVLGLLSLKEDATTAEVAAKIAALQNPANFVPVEQYNQVVNKLNEQEGAGLVELALKEGKITPAQRSWAEGYAKESPEGFKEFLEKAAPVVPMGQLVCKAKATQKNPAGEFEPLICKAMGLTAEELKKYGKGEE